MPNFQPRTDVPEDLQKSRLGSVWLLWPSRESGPWLVRLDWTRVQGRFECCGIEVRSFREPGEDWPAELPVVTEASEVLTRAVLRDIPLGKMLSDIRAAAYAQNMGLASDLEPSDPEGAEQLRAMARRHGGRRRAGLKHTPSSEEVAAVYMQHAGGQGKPTAAVAAAFNNAPYSTAAKWVARARRDGLIPPATTGRPGRQS